jgi:hypothetical protein
MNNKLIEEAYAVSKRREYVQHHIGEVDMSILDTYDNVVPLEGYSKAMQHMQQLKPRNNDDEEDDSRS